MEDLMQGTQAVSELEAILSILSPSEAMDSANIED